MLKSINSNKIRTLGVFFTLLFSVSSCILFENCLQGEGKTVEKELQLKPFHSIELSTSAEVFLKKGAKQKVMIVAQENLIPLFETSVEDGVWEIQTSRCIKDSQPIKLYLQLPEIKMVEIKGSGGVSSENLFTANEINLNIEGSGDISLNLDAKEINSRISGSGEINLQGKAKSHFVKINGSGDLNASKLETDVTEIDINGSGDAFIDVSYELDVEVNGSGDVNYSGSVKKLNSDIKGSGRLNQMN